MIDRKNAAMGGQASETMPDLTDAEDLQSIVFAVGKNHGFDPLRDWFTALYEVLLGASEGPRFGGFMALYGLEDSKRLIQGGLDGTLWRIVDPVQSTL